MGIPFQYIARRDNPLVYTSSGYSDLSAAVPEGYMLVVGELPVGAVREQPQKSLSMRLAEKFEGVPRSLASPILRGHLRILQAAILVSLQAPVQDIEAAKALIATAKMPDGSDLPPELGAFRDILLDEPEFMAIP